MAIIVWILIYALCFYILTGPFFSGITPDSGLGQAPQNRTFR